MRVRHSTGKYSNMSGGWDMLRHWNRWKRKRVFEIQLAQPSLPAARWLPQSDWLNSVKTALHRKAANKMPTKVKSDERGRETVTELQKSSKMNWGRRSPRALGVLGPLFHNFEGKRSCLVHCNPRNHGHTGCDTVEGCNDGWFVALNRYLFQVGWGPNLNAHSEACADMVWWSSRRCTLRQIGGNCVVQEEVVELHTACRFLRRNNYSRRESWLKTKTLKAEEHRRTKIVFFKKLSDVWRVSVPVGAVLTFLLQQ